MNTKSTIRKNANNFLTYTKKERGITLIALVVTIIILLILAGVSLQIALGENGLFTYSRKAGEEHCHQAVKEALEMSATTYEMDKLANNGNKSLVEYLQEKGIIEDIGEEGNYQINVKTLVGSKMQLGNGSERKDVYMLEENKGLAELGKYATTGKIKIAEASSGRKEYLIKYYGKTEEENRDLGKLVDSGTEGSSSNSQEALIKEIEEMYYIEAYWNKEESKLDYFALYLLPEVEYKVEEYVFSTNEELSKMTDEEIVLKNGYTNANTFEEYMQEIGKGYKTAREFIESEDYFGGYYNRELTDEEYEKEILNCKKNLIGIYNSNNETFNSTEITGIGDYKYTVKVNEAELFNFTITIDQYEIIEFETYGLESLENVSYNPLVNKNKISELIKPIAWFPPYDAVVLYDFTNNKIMNIDGGSVVYNNENKNITNDMIKKAEGLESYIKMEANGTYYWKLRSNNIKVNGYSFGERIGEDID